MGSEKKRGWGLLIALHIASRYEDPFPTRGDIHLSTAVHARSYEEPLTIASVYELLAPDKEGKHIRNRQPLSPCLHGPTSN